MANKWITFWASKSKGKKFSSREERHKFMQKCLSEWRSKKGRGSELLLQPGLGSTTGDKLVGAGNELLLQPGLGVTTARYTRGF